MAETNNAPRELLTQARLHQLLDYDPLTGVFVWLRRQRQDFGTQNAYATWNSRYAGKPAGVRTHGYIRISIDDRKHYAHRLAWLYMTGEWPNDLLDHKNEVRDDNRFDNLRDANKSQNHANNRRPFKNNQCGYRGVYKVAEGRFIAQMHREGRGKYLGTYPTAKEAHAAYSRALREKHGEYAP